MIDDYSIYMSLGLVKRAEIKIANIDEIIVDSTILQEKASKETIEFIGKDFGELHPNILLKLKRPMKATLFMGIQKEYSKPEIK